MSTFETKSHLINQDLQELRKFIINSNLVNERDLLLLSISRGFVSTLPVKSSPLSQLISDLDRINAINELKNGSIPMIQLLQNITIWCDAADLKHELILELLD